LTAEEVAALSGTTVGVGAAVRVGPTTARHATLPGRTVAVGLTSVAGRLTLSADADLHARAIGVDFTAGIDRLALAVQTPLTLGAIAVDLALRSRGTISEFADTTVGTVGIRLALRRWQRHTGAPQTRLPFGAIGIGLASIGHLAGVVDAFGWPRTVFISLAQRRRNAAAAHATPGGGTLVIVHAHHRHATVEITALAFGAIAVDLALRRRPTESVVADRPVGTVVVTATLGDLDASISETPLIRGTIVVGLAGDILLALAGHGIALLAIGAVIVASTPLRRAAESIVAHLAVAAVVVRLAVSRLGALTFDATLAVVAVIVLLTAGRCLALIVDALLAVGAIGGLPTFARLAGAILAELARRTVVILPAGRGRDSADALVADLFAGAIAVACALAGIDADAGDATLVGAAVAVDGAAAAQRGPTTGGQPDQADQHRHDQSNRVSHRRSPSKT
jgi:hypothetical protein